MITKGIVPVANLIRGSTQQILFISQVFLAPHVKLPIDRTDFEPADTLANKLFHLALCQAQSLL
jgi:hypothetical protein